MDRLKSGIFWAVLVSEASHVFCCVLPTVVSVISLLAGAGMLSALPGPVLAIHDALHAYEIPMICASALILAAGWAMHYVSLKLDCRGTGCAHEPCSPKKDRTKLLLLGATALFCFNLTIYAVFHAGHESFSAEAQHSGLHKD